MIYTYINVPIIRKVVNLVVLQCVTISTFNALCSLVSFLQFKKREKHASMSTNFSNFTKSNIPPWVFFTFLKIVQRKTSHIIVMLLFCLFNPCIPKDSQSIYLGRELWFCDGEISAKKELSRWFDQNVKHCQTGLRIPKDFITCYILRIPDHNKLDKWICNRSGGENHDKSVMWHAITIFLKVKWSTFERR